MGALEIAIVGILCITSFVMGAKLGQTVSKGEKIETPTVNPIKLYKEHKSREKAEEELDKIDTILRNIEAYDGTPNGQKDVPRG